ncbi:MAG: hypothetical protein NE327_18080 [Lentisphaeraceae bacterium]|nr:hypothetical protein [Lentisphaeraceae bacterium]
MKFFTGLNFILSIALGYFVYDNHQKSQSYKPELKEVKEIVLRAEKSNDENNKLLLELKVRLQKLDKNVNGHEVGDSLRSQIGALQSDVEALQKKLR